MSAVTRVRSWSAEEFAESRHAWTALLAASDADPLFMSWEWQWGWWIHHAPLLRARLRLLGVYDDAHTLIGLAPFYARDLRVRGVLPATRVEIIGSAWRDANAAFSEYLDVISDRRYADAVGRAIAVWLEADDSWDELVLANAKADSLAKRLAREHLASFARLREVDPMDAHSIGLSPRFEDYVERLTSQTRRKLHHQRSKLRNPSLIVARTEDVLSCLETLERFRAMRWGNPVHRSARAFHRQLAADMAASGRLRLTQLVSDGSPLSTMFNVRIDGTEYYLQSGYDTERAQGISPGYLHFGYTIEDACNAGLERFDLLGGRGRHRDYKRDLLAERAPLACFHAVRSPALRALHAAYDWVR